MPRKLSDRAFFINRLRYLAQKGSTDTIKLRACEIWVSLEKAPDPTALPVSPAAEKKDSVVEKMVEESKKLGRSHAIPKSRASGS